MRVLTLLIFFGCDWKQSSLYFSYLLQHFHSHYHILPLKSSWRWVRLNVTIAMLKGGGSCIPEGLSVLFKAAELVQDKTSLKIGFPDSQNFIFALLHWLKTNGSCGFLFWLLVWGNREMDLGNAPLAVLCGLVTAIQRSWWDIGARPFLLPSHQVEWEN